MDKKKRSANYTNQEKTMLFTLAEKYKDVIDCKNTGALYIEKKKEAWIAISKIYNRMSTTGPRSAAMLKNAYNNLKHRKFSISENEQTSEISTPAPVELSEENSDDDDDNDDDDDGSVIDVKLFIDDLQKDPDKIGSPCDSLIVIQDSCNHLATCDQARQVDSPPRNVSIEHRDKPIEIEELELPTIPQNNLKRTSPVMKRKPKFNLQSQMKNKSADFLKKMYYKKKIELVSFQKKFEMQKFRFEKEKQELQLKVLKKQLENEMKKV